MRPNGFLLKSAIAASLGGLLFGFDTAVISGTTRSLTALYHLSPSGLGLTVSSALLGTIPGSLFAGMLGDRFGRRDFMRVLAVCYLISALGCAFAPGWYSLLVFRFIGGLGVGGSSVLGPMYIAEIAPPEWRGRLVGLFQFNIVFGILPAYLSNYAIGTLGFGDAEWRWKFGVAAVPAGLFLTMLFTIRRSPRWLAMRGRLDEARAVLQASGAADYENNWAISCVRSDRRKRSTGSRYSSASTGCRSSSASRSGSSLSFRGSTPSFITSTTSSIAPASAKSRATRSR